MAVSHAPTVASAAPRTSRTGRRVLFFGTYDARKYPRVQVLQEGFAALGDEVLECNVPLRLDTAARVRMLRRPWTVPHASDRVRVVFFGSFTPLQGAPVIGEALRMLADDERFAFTIVGRGQDYDVTRTSAAGASNVEWIDWVEPEQLPHLVACHDVCLGIFGTGPKALRVVPNKVFQGAAAGAAIVTSDTPPQRQELCDSAVFVPAGDAAALAVALRSLADDRDRLWELRRAAFERANERFHPAAVIVALNARLPAPVAVAATRPLAA